MCFPNYAHDEGTVCAVAEFLMCFPNYAHDEGTVCAVAEFLMCFPNYAHDEGTVCAVTQKWFFYLISLGIHIIWGKTFDAIENQNCNSLNMHIMTWPNFALVGHERMLQSQTALVYVNRIRWYPTKRAHAYAWQIGPFWQDTLDLYDVHNNWMISIHIDL